MSSLITRNSFPSSRCRMGVPQSGDSAYGFCDTEAPPTQQPQAYDDRYPHSFNQTPFTRAQSSGTFAQGTSFVQGQGNFAQGSGNFVQVCTIFSLVFLHFTVVRHSLDYFWFYKLSLCKKPRRYLAPLLCLRRTYIQTLALVGCSQQE